MGGMVFNMDNITERVFYHFKELSKIPRGSENMEGICNFCIEFAKKNSLSYKVDSSKNVVIYKKGSKGFEDKEPVILQGHMDMVCQKDEDVEFDFLKDGIIIEDDGEIITAKGTTLGADNGIAMAMTMTILESDEISHPPIEAVFTIDEEIGLIGATNLDEKLLSANRMINLDAEEEDILTVSCAGGRDFVMKSSVNTLKKAGKIASLEIKGLKGGHSGVEINKGRVNANILMGRILNSLKKTNDFSVCEVLGGDKSNAITNLCCAKIVTDDLTKLKTRVQSLYTIIKEEISTREPDFLIELKDLGEGECEVLDEKALGQLVFTLVCVPDGVVQMSADIDGLVETSLNLGVLKADASGIYSQHSLRSNKQSALDNLEDRLRVFGENNGLECVSSGAYPPWEFNADSTLQKIYKECFVQHYGFEPKVEAIHAGLECGVFASKIKNMDCIAMGPTLYDVHTTKERFEKKSVRETFRLLLKILEKC